MFKTEQNIKSSKPLIDASIRAAEKNYLIQKNDYLEVRVYTNNGEIITLPPEPDNSQNQQAGFQQQFQQQQLLQQAQFVQGNQFPLQNPIFLVQQDGFVKLPKVGKIKVENLTLDQADSLLEIKYNDIYKECFVRTRYNNKRVVVFRGTTGSIFPLRNEKISLLEVLASVGGMDNNLKATNIRLIRGDLQDPDVFVINLSTIGGMKAQNLMLEPNDIIYIEPIRRPFFESIRDISPILSVITSVVALVILIAR